jgi:hypothetical protein
MALRRGTAPLIGLTPEDIVRENIQKKAQEERNQYEALLQQHAAEESETIAMRLRQVEDFVWEIPRAIRRLKKMNYQRGRIERIYVRSNPKRTLFFSKYDELVYEDRAVWPITSGKLGLEIGADGSLYRIQRPIDSEGNPLYDRYGRLHDKQYMKVTATDLEQSMRRDLTSFIVRTEWQQALISLQRLGTRNS